MLNFAMFTFAAYQFNFSTMENAELKLRSGMQSLAINDGVDFLVLFDRRLIGTGTFKAINIVQHIFGLLDYQDFLNAEKVSVLWRKVISHSNLWKNMVERMVLQNSLWKPIINWIENQPDFINNKSPLTKDHIYYKKLYRSIIQHLKELDTNWRTGACVIRENLNPGTECVTCFHLDDYRLFAGFLHGIIRVWNRWTLELLQEYENHEQVFDKGQDLQVLDFTFNENMMISVHTHFENTLKVWNMENRELLNMWIYKSGGNNHLVKLHRDLLIAIGCTLTIRKIYSSAIPTPSDDGTILELQDYRVALEIDKNTILIFLANGICEIRSISERHDVLRSLDLGLSRFSEYKNGVVCVESYGEGTFLVADNFKFWDIDTGQPIQLGLEMDYLRLSFNSKFIVIVNSSERAFSMEGIREKYGTKIRDYKEMKTWDKKKLFGKQNESSAIISPLCTLPAYNWCRRRADDVQVVITDYEGQLVVLSFLPLFPEVAGRNTYASLSTFNDDHQLFKAIYGDTY